jgi:putative inorganic carbon (HCO3(-)) transporter
MHVTLRALDRRAAALLCIGLIAATGFGLVAGRWPAVALGGAAALVLGAVMLRDLAVGIVGFTAVSFAGVLAVGSASAAKGVGALLVLAWIATLAGRSRAHVRGLLSDHRSLVACMTLLLAWSVVSAVWSQSPATALSGAGRWAQDLILLPVVYTGIRRLEHIRWVAVAFVAGALLAVMYGLLSGYTIDGSRLASALDDPNETAAVLLAAGALAFAIGAGELRAGRRSLAFAAALLALLGVASTASRGGLVALGAAGVAAIVVAGRWRARVTAIAVAGAVLVAGWFVLLAPAGSRSHISNLQSGRSTLWTVAERAIAANPVIGVGNDNYRLVARDYLVRPGLTTDASQVVIDPKVAHNVYLEIWADLGVIGLALFAGLIIASLRSALAAANALRRAGRGAEEILARGVVVATVAMLAADLFMSDLYSKQLFLLLALGPAIWGAARMELSPSAWDASRRQAGQS